MRINILIVHADFQIYLSRERKMSDECGKILTKKQFYHTCEINIEKWMGFGREPQFLPQTAKNKLLEYRRQLSYFMQKESRI